ncbi:MAG: hypothetical protein HYV37_03025 [Candidatus Levyibacteriota bacterium]|nr:MAG: hypothetical protein HYV37_03025 [Candidatus Levybacteria bacterium]
MTRRKYIFILLAFVIFVFLFLFYRSSNKKPTSTEKVTSTTSAQATPTEIVQELHFTEEQLKSYYSSYNNPFVLHIRKVLNNYLTGNNDGIEPLAIKVDKAEDGTISGLDSFSKDYYKSKFIVFGINDSIAGGKEINIIFQDKQDKLFNVWIYKLGTGDYELRGFWQNKKFTEKDMEKIQKQYKIFLNDSKHAL